jgi:hypothetical protein
MSAANAWRQHFSKPAADLIQIVSCLGGYDLQQILLRCFRKSRRGLKVNEPTVLQVLQEMKDEEEDRAEALAKEIAARV